MDVNGNKKNFSKREKEREEHSTSQRTPIKLWSSIYLKKGDIARGTVRILGGF